jgi:hypothetical protein
MTFTRSPIFRITVALMILALPVASHAADLAKPSGGGASIEWQIGLTGYDSVELTVLAPNGDSWTKKFAAGRTPSFRLLDLGGELADGHYNYQMRVVPKISADLRTKLNAARASGNDAATRKIMREAGIVAPEQSGTFQILNGAFVAPGSLESGGTSASGRGITAEGVPGRGIAVQDQVIPDDLIVQSSTCTGFDCVNGESFGFDTLRLKENNLRIHFDDTSTSAGFPANDWRIIANDSGSGGGNFLSIEDSTAARNIFVAEAGSPSNALYIDSTGNIGISQSAPGLDLHMTTTDTPAMRMEQTSAGGFTAQTWDIGANEANFFVRDLTGGSRLSFRIRPGAPTSSIDIAASGNVGIGTASPARLLHLNSSSGNAAIQFTNNTAKSWHIANSGNDLNVSETGVADARLYVKAGGNVGIACNAPGARLVVASGGGCSTPSSSLNPGDAQFTVASSRTFKENLSPVAVPDVLDRIGKVGVYNYDFIDGPKDRIGLIAEDFHEVLGRGDEKYINGGEVQVALWLAVQQLTAQNKALTERLDALDKELALRQKQ